MARILGRIVLGTAFAILVLGGSSGQGPADGPPRRFGLIPFSDEEAAEFRATHAEVTRVHLNRIGFERVNEVRRRQGLPPLDRSLVRPVGQETESAIREPLAQAQAAPAAGYAAFLPVAVDNSLLPYFPPVRDQGAIGACVGFATTYTQLSYMTAIQHDLDIDDPADDTGKFSPKWTYNLINGGADRGGSLAEAYEVLGKNGALTWAELPYDADYLAWCRDPAQWRSALGARTQKVECVHYCHTLTQLRELLANGYVLVFGTYFGSWRYRTILDDPSTSDDDAEVGKLAGSWVDGREGSHAMVVVGYNDALWTDLNGNGMIESFEKGAFRIANSWGEEWGDGGFVWLAYDALDDVSDLPAVDRQYAFHYDQAFVLRARDAYGPLMVAEFTLSHAKREQIWVRLGLSEATRNYPTEWWVPGALQNQGGAMAFDGGVSAVPAGFAFDFTDILVAGAGLQRFYLFVTENTAGDPVTVLDYKIVDLTTAPPTEAVCATVPITADNQEFYPYVEYLYSGPGPGENRPPALSQCSVSPAYGDASQTYRFTVQYVDQDHDVPSAMEIYVDGEPHVMTHCNGSAYWGQYEYTAALPVGGHEYYYVFSDGRGATVRNPLTGSFDGPEVYPFLITSLSPGVASAGGPTFVLTVTGSNLVEGAVVRWDGSDRPTTFADGTRLDASIGAGDVAIGRSAPVTVRNPDGSTSNPLTFLVRNPVPALLALSPTSVSGGGAGFDLTVTGERFVPNSIVVFDGKAKATTFVGPTELRASVGAEEIAASGAFEVKVYNPPPEGGFCPSPRAFTVSGFKVGYSPGYQTVTAGETATYSVVVLYDRAPFTNPIHLTVKDLPKGCTATLTPDTVVLSGTDPTTCTLAVRTKAPSGSISGLTSERPGTGPPGPGILLALLPVLALFFAAARSGQKRIPYGLSVRRALVAAAAIWLAIVVADCSSGGGDSGPPDPGTPAGTYTFPVQGTSGSFVASTTLTLKVR